MPKFGYGYSYFTPTAICGTKGVGIFHARAQSCPTMRVIPRKSCESCTACTQSKSLPVAASVCARGHPLHTLRASDPYGNRGAQRKGARIHEALLNPDKQSCITQFNTGRVVLRRTIRKQHAFPLPRCVVFFNVFSSSIRFFAQNSNSLQHTPVVAGYDTLVTYYPVGNVWWIIIPQ